MRRVVLGPEPPHNGTGFGAFVVTLIAVGLLATVALAEPGTTLLVAVIGACVVIAVPTN